MQTKWLSKIYTPTKYYTLECLNNHRIKKYKTKAITETGYTDFVVQHWTRLLLRIQFYKITT